MSESDLVSHRVYSYRTTTYDSYSRLYDIWEDFLEDPLRIWCMLAWTDDSDKWWERISEIASYIEKKRSMTYSFQSLRILPVVESHYFYRLLYEEFPYFFYLYYLCFCIYLLLPFWSDIRIYTSDQCIIPEFFRAGNISWGEYILEIMMCISCLQEIGEMEAIIIEHISVWKSYWGQWQDLQESE